MASVIGQGPRERKREGKKIFCTGKKKKCPKQGRHFLSDRDGGCREIQLLLSIAPKQKKTSSAVIGGKEGGKRSQRERNWGGSFPPATKDALLMGGTLREGRSVAWKSWRSKR